MRGCGLDLDVTLRWSIHLPKQHIATTQLRLLLGGLCEHFGFVFLFCAALLPANFLSGFRSYSVQSFAMDAASQGKKHIVIVGKCP
jgi:hypothetical protein